MMRLRHEVTDAQLDAVLADLSTEDAAELEAAGIVDRKASFLEGLERSLLRGTVLLDERPVSVFGCVRDPSLEGTGIPWMIATPGFRSDKRRAMEFSELVVAYMKGMFPYLHNWVHREHSTAIAWLTWLGFKVDPAPVGPGSAFLHFEWSRDV